MPLHRTRAERFDDLVLEAVARLEPRWETRLAGIEFAVEETPPPAAMVEVPPGAVPLGRLDPGSPATAGGPGGTGGPADGDGGGLGGDGEVLGGDGDTRPPRIVVYRRPLMARAEGEEDLGELVFDVVVEEFARLLGVDPQDVDPDYPTED